MSERTTAEAVARAAQLACLLEVTAPKPGNVSPGRPFADMSVDDFLRSAAAIGAPFRAAGVQSVGHTVLDAVLATRRVTATNTNLGIVLLLAPLARAAHQCAAGEELRAAAGRVLAATTVDDARHVYAAIRAASPAGLGAAPDQDVAREPTAPLVEVMRLAAHRDDVAREYATHYERTFGIGAPLVRSLRQAGHRWDDVIVQVFLTLLAARPDTHIARRVGAPRAREVSAAAADVLRVGPIGSGAWKAAVHLFDSKLRDPRNTTNPGTTADLTTSSLFVELLTPA